jgi:hypothetical protein
LEEACAAANLSADEILDSLEMAEPASQAGRTEGNCGARFLWCLDINRSSPG